MKFILTMAWRDSRASRKRLALFSLSVVLGIAALVAIGSFSRNLRQAVEDQAKGLLGADLVLESRDPFSAGLQSYVSTLGEVARDQMFSSMAVFPTSGGATRLVQVRAMAGAFPFYGDFETIPADAPARLRAGGNVAVVEETLLEQFGVAVGGQVKLGQTTFTVAGALKAIPGESMAVTMLAPRIFIPMDALAATELAGPGKELLTRHRLELKLPPTADPLQVERNITSRFRGERLSSDTVEERKRQMGRALENIQGFLSLVGFIALFLGGVGVASAMHVYVRQKVGTVAVLRCLGASARQSFAVYLLQGLGLGLFGAVLGASLGVAVQFALPALLQDMLPVKIQLSIAWPAVAEGMIAGLAICLLFALLPLLAIRRVSPLVAIRSAFADAGAAPDPWRIVIGVGILGAVTGFAIWQTGQLRIGLGFAAMLVLSFALLAAVAQGVMWAARRWFPRGLPYVARQGVANLYRPNNRTALLLVSLGLGTFLILTLYLTRTTLLRELQIADESGRPNLLLFDVQDDQVESLKKIATDEHVPVVQEAPIVTMKIAALKGRTVEQALRDNRGGRGATPPVGAAPGGDEGRGGRGGRGGGNGGGPAGWTLRREYRSTYREKLDDTEKLVAGTFTGRAEPGAAVYPISLEEGVFNSMGLQLGDEITWDVQGVMIPTKVTSVRSVQWRQLGANFFAVFPAGVLEAAPKFHVMALRASGPADSARFQRVAIAAHPNVTAIDLALVMQTIDNVTSKVSFVIEFMALFTVATGIIVLAGSVMTGRYQRIRETVLLRTLGASRRQLVRIQLIEYAILGLLGAVVGCGLAVLGNWLFAFYVLDLPPAAPVGQLLAAVLAVMTVTLTTGLLSSRGITNHPPLEVLRQET
jgi:putative ABC transport system permease protein